ncbi:cellulose binding domain-containing protein [Micromonospora cathayae]|uniref:Cellulose binding domain-containing protein n=1 Tax=Micromonospora cathayae TaxID=3028804 RepID=A0ABY7ZKS2_9ACTN|nr:cellulose binding domain-containing protein [Micromonospora sp. HUAS 3]WDZ83545.1 cellulose binding domain-containing protein [Micromonospora sp. HUAS 3]
MKLVKNNRPWRTGLVLATTAVLAVTGSVLAVSAQAAAGCRVDYRVTNSWAGGFGADVTVTNLGDAVNGWRLGWTFPAGQQVTQAWSATIPTGTSTVTATNVDYNAAIPTNGTVNFGFNGTQNGSNPAPTSFTLNGTVCTGSTAPTTPPPATTAPPTTPPPTTPPPSGPYSNTPDGFAGAAGTTGGQGGTTVTVTNQADLERYAAASTPHIIRVNSAITVSPYGKEIRVGSNKTIVGVGKNGHIVGGGFFLGAGTSNVIIRNLTIRDTRVASDDPDDKDFDYDAIQLDTADRIWIDHNHLTRMNDGLIDSRKDTTNLTVSWNVIAENNKTFGIGWTENVTARITIHHNWIRDTNSRNPSTDNVAYAHLYNNYLQNVTGYGNYSRGATRMVLENSYFDKVKDPYYKDTTAELRQSGSIVVNSSGKQQTGGSAFNPSSFYSYRLDPAAEVPNLVRTYAGPQSNIG